MSRPESEYDVELLISEADIAARVSALASEITSHYSTSDSLVAVGLLKGSFIFMADLVRRLDLLVELDFMTVSSYGSGTTSSRDVRILKDLKGSVEGHDVLVIEDLVDTGRTLNRVLRILSARQPKSLEACCLLNKASRREVDVPVRWVGFDIPDEFVVGYGLDYAQRSRNLPHIGKVTVRER